MPTPPKKRHRPRPRPYDPDIDPLLTRWAAERQLNINATAKRIGVPAHHFRRWMSEHPELNQAISTGQRIADAQAIDALFKRALGYNFENTTTSVTKKIKNSRGGGSVTQKKSQHHLKPDVQALIFWLINRLPDQWRAAPPPARAAEIIARIRAFPSLPMITALPIRNDTSRPPTSSREAEDYNATDSNRR